MTSRICQRRTFLVWARVFTRYATYYTHHTHDTHHTHYTHHDTQQVCLGRGLPPNGPEWHEIRVGVLKALPDLSEVRSVCSVRSVQCAAVFCISASKALALAFLSPLPHFGKPPCSRPRLTPLLAVRVFRFSSPLFVSSASLHLSSSLPPLFTSLRLFRLSSPLFVSSS
jgi:hypothetical protein